MFTLKVELLTEGWSTGRMMAEVWRCSHTLGVPILARHLDHLLHFVLSGPDVEAPVVLHLAHLLVDVRLLRISVLLRQQSASGFLISEPPAGAGRPGHLVILVECDEDSAVSGVLVSEVLCQ